MDGGRRVVAQFRVRPRRGFTVVSRIGYGQKSWNGVFSFGDQQSTGGLGKMNLSNFSLETMGHSIMGPSRL